VGGDECGEVFDVSAVVKEGNGKGREYFSIIVVIFYVGPLASRQRPPVPPFPTE
jgi:hypothetical protein